MFRIKTLNKISPAGLSVLDQTRFSVSDDVENEDGILVRSADMHEYQFPDSLRAIARAGAGTNNIPIDRCSEAGIVVFNTPGANANAVKELALCALLLASRKITAGAEWVKAQAGAGADVEKVVEKGKSQFVGPEIAGKTLGVIGLGAIGVQVANIATKLGMTVFGYDPFLSVDAALSLSRMVHRAMDLETIYKNCDYITLHVPQTSETKGMINEDAFHMMKGGVRILNLARGGLVNDDDMLAALDSGKVAAYVTDFPNNKILQGKNVIAIPHLGASTPESEENCAVMAAQELKDYLENGNIKNSVNLPTLVQEWSGVARLCIIHRNIPGAIANITGLLSRDGVNVENMTNKSKKDYAYTVVDLGSRISEAVADEIRALEGVFRVRVLNH
ncbi:MULTISPECIES: phosphoglycerate dehydrogenase [unclassified Flavonifractor]|uniref:phosphoglycerate dehydrogenase n=1 Tax=unclassified Flavonifractor TaxID=2629267 RepID=UPI000B3A7E5F|nr:MULTISPECIES: phosphoglycerate dehydrogenase [unclassified Flavonifractor]HIZ93271.1 phosphoglycerate dehydrogenase [Candidatus Flavonifractor avicola]OUN10441.1 3-phosphoglycerate dehydrogenase [Flavonifractor sp. An9]OUN14389.1 3-phosphoglycerate dehydrogenase [Flavonifractor sp. An91]OUN85895.1 3-phosphoglycerate dehydrogenase [Flavonifractor sp. An52]OUO11694.1 3-phosphoglycerate dehydrogenase [Flavonifractor sp. An4]